MKTKFNIIECGISDELNILTPKDLSELTGGCLIDVCWVKACGLQIHVTEEGDREEEDMAFLQNQ